MFASFPGKEAGLCDKAGLQPREYHSRSGTDDVLLRIPNASCEELVLQLVSFISFTLRKELSIQLLMISSALWSLFPSPVERFFFLEYVGIQQQFRL